MNFEKAFEEIRSRNQEETLSDERKEELEKMMEEMYYEKPEENYKLIKYQNKYHNFQKKIAAVFVCFLVLSGCAFAGGFENFIAKFFSNQDKNIEFAFENGYVQNVEMDYIENEGVKIRPEYFYLDDYYMYFAFDVVADREFDEMIFKKFEISDKNNEYVFSKDELYDKGIFFEMNTKRMTNTNGIVILKISNLQETFLDSSSLKFIIKEIAIRNKIDCIDLTYNWNFNLETNRKVEKDNVEYYIDSQQLVENYQIKLENSVLKVNLKMKERYMENFIMTKNNIYIEDESGDIYNVGDVAGNKADEIETIFYIDSNKDIDNLKLKIKYDEDNVLIFYLKKADS